MVELATIRPYEPGDKVVQVRSDWVALMLEDMGVFESDVDSKLQSAIKRWVAGYIEGANELGIDLTMGELNTLADAYQTGYSEALVDAGLQQPDGRDPFPPGEGVEG